VRETFSKFVVFGLVHRVLNVFEPQEGAQMKNIYKENPKTLRKRESVKN